MFAIPEHKHSQISLLEAEFERQFSLSKTKELLKDLKTSRQAGSPDKKTEEIACENGGYLWFMEASLQELGDSSSKTMRQAFCGFHYQPATIEKFFRELKYYDLEHVLNQTLGPFWFSVWNSNPGNTVILFVDNKLNHLYTD